MEIQKMIELAVQMQCADKANAGVSGSCIPRPKELSEYMKEIREAMKNKSE